MSINYIFSINSGRSGSDYLTEIFSKTTNAISIHEGFPIMNGKPMQAFNQGEDTALRQLMPLKLKQINKSRQKGKKIYCETNHSYIKGWGYLIPEKYIPQEEIAVILLRRNIDDSAYSLLRVHDIPGYTEFSRTWYLSPDATFNLSHPPAKANVYELCRWYVQETNLRAEHYQSKFPNITYFECDLEQLNDYDFVLKMFETLGLNPSPELKSTCGKPLNSRSEWPKLSLEQLLEVSPYPKVDDLPPEDRDLRLKQMLDYIKQNYAAEIQRMEPNYAMGGTLALAAIRIVALAEAELENHFQVSLKFSELEKILILELTRSINHQDFSFVFATRHVMPSIHYQYDFNCIPDLRTIITILGMTAIPRIMKVVFKGLWGRDYTHRQAGS
jgi:hypothetical protein